MDRQIDRRDVLTAWLAWLAAIASATISEAEAEQPAAAVELVYVHDPGCPYCRRFDRAIAPIYPRTPEARRAPMRRVEKGSAEFKAVAFATPVRYTPTFVLMRGGVEIGRIEGYPGDDFFFAVLGRLLEKLPPAGG